MINHLKSCICGLATTAMFLSASSVYALETIEVDLYKATNEGNGEAIGTVTLEKNEHGVLIISSLTQLSPGVHGFHLHENPDCGPKTKGDDIIPAGAAGGHYDPENTGVHRGPFNSDGHLGDLPRLQVGQGGDAQQTSLVPRLQLSDFRGRALVIHQGGDNYSDDPRPLGGGGARIACGVIPG